MYPITKLAIQKEIEYILKQLKDLPELEEMLKFTTTSFPIIAKDFEKKLEQLREDLTNYGAINNLKNAFVEVNNNDLKLIREYCEKGLKESTGICASPETGDFSNGWNECRQEAFIMKNNLLQGILDIIDSDLK